MDKVIGIHRNCGLSKQNGSCSHYVLKSLINKAAYVLPFGYNFPQPARESTQSLFLAARAWPLDSIRRRGTKLLAFPCVIYNN